MMDTYISVTGQDGEVYEILPTEALVRFLQCLAESEHAEQKKTAYEPAYSRANIRTGQIYEGAPFTEEALFLMSGQAPSFETFMDRWTRDEQLSSLR